MHAPFRLAFDCVYSLSNPSSCKHRAYSRHVDTNVYVSPTMVLSRNTSIIPVIIAPHLPSCRDRVVCELHYPDRYTATLSRKCFVLLVIVLILSKYNAVIVIARKVGEQ